MRMHDLIQQPDREEAKFDTITIWIGDVDIGGPEREALNWRADRSEKQGGQIQRLSPRRG